MLRGGSRGHGPRRGPSAPPRPRPRPPHTMSPSFQRRPRGERRELVRNRLIESRLTPNAISITGLLLCVVGAVLGAERYFFLAGLACIVGSGGGRGGGGGWGRWGKGAPFGAFLDSTLDRIEEGIVL